VARVAPDRLLTPCGAAFDAIARGQRVTAAARSPHGPRRHAGRSPVGALSSTAPSWASLRRQHHDTCPRRTRHAVTCPCSDRTRRAPPARATRCGATVSRPTVRPTVNHEASVTCGDVVAYVVGQGTTGPYPSPSSAGPRIAPELPQAGPLALRRPPLATFQSNSIATVRSGLRREWGGIARGCPRACDRSGGRGPVASCASTRGAARRFRGWGICRGPSGSSFWGRGGG
jgi:hypothetical protein